MSLLEILLVLGILSVLAAIVVPSYNAFVVRQRIRQSVERLEVELQEARMQAIRSGQAQMLRFQIGTSEYVSQPWMSESDAVNAGPGATVQNAVGQIVQTSTNPLEVVAEVKPTTAKKLDEGVLISSANTQNDSRTMMAQLEVGTTTGATWSTPILFYPDGSSTTAEIIIEDQLGNRTSVQIRGITGQVNVVVLPSVPGV